MIRTIDTITCIQDKKIFNDRYKEIYICTLSDTIFSWNPIHTESYLVWKNIKLKLAPNPLKSPPRFVLVINRIWPDSTGFDRILEIFLILF